jgi:putative inorganic carbon (HCO3(-)) transporter
LQTKLERAAFYLTCGSAVSILFSIAVSQILMALALAAVLTSGTKLSFPPIKLPLLLFVGGTIVSWLASGHIREGTPQIRKFFVFAILFLVVSTFRELAECRALVLLWTAVASLSALRSLFQFLQVYRRSVEEHQPFYDFYVGSRITGFMSHWTTLGGEEMIVLLMLVAYLFFSHDRRWKLLGSGCALLLGVSLVLSLDRSIFLLGVPAGGIYLLWIWRRWTVALVPVLAVVAFFLAPAFVRERVKSVIQPHGETDSNQHRLVSFRTGIEMIEEHPLLGLGPEQVGAQFQQYVPEDIPRPLPEGWYGHLHNIYLQYAAERGIPTALCMLWMLGKIMFDFSRGLRRKAEARFLLHGAIAVVLAILAEGFFDYNLGDSEVLTMFLTVTGLGYVAIERA